ncbi:putative PEP-binding protein [Thermocatellispora tengchongensis]|uniref:putative PEP-binding protein n=1 Tax=Thermocatellispora tengchongensis TaxID=1073253 RepID=UPI00363708D8
MARPASYGCRPARTRSPPRATRRRPGRRSSPRPPAPAGTADGHLVPLLANVGGPKDLEAALANGAEGVGLYRTEFLFLDRAEPPGAEEQEAAYRAVLNAFPGGRVVVRTLDAGADKPLAFLPPPARSPTRRWASAACACSGCTRR